MPYWKWLWVCGVAGMADLDLTWAMAVRLFFFPSRLFYRDWVSVSCFTGQLPGSGTVFILASLQMCKVQGQSPLASQGGWGGRRLESAGSGGSCARRSLRVGGCGCLTNMPCTASKSRYQNQSHQNIHSGRTLE